ncbi:protein kinase domain-containing protein [Chiayiivirga flava]|uniref:non-specific serine/threonine protein kinase n=1 Tax=Chiayiivirga flava TaxID=659595 RepID=A0A7W8D5I3_9GAMM|nr:serine/threonine protein kinase [Chiayiivirga flava]
MIEIPGYRLLQTLGRGGMATVYLALQESVQREVALKVMSTTLLGDAQFGERFLREARIAAKLRHPNVVQVHDVGIAGEHHYIAMEYLPGGPVLGRSGIPREPAFALRVTREIASALNYAGARGIVHRDIKPDNILLREDGVAALTDFGIARASDNSRMTRTGAIIGTPHYMSPEQARGLPLDGRADLYSLGIVLHELLVGKVPYQADDSLAVGIMHITAPLPRLPEHLAELQPLLDRMLAKEPAQRFQSGEEVCSAIEAIEHRPQAHPTRTQVLPRVDTPPLLPAGMRRSDGDADHEPQLGRIDDVLRTPAPRWRTHAKQAPRRRTWLWGTLALLAVLGATTFVFQDRLRDLLPQTRMNALLERADAALAQNILTRADGQGASELYRAAAALDPDSQPARDGLRRVGERFVLQARAALDAGDVAAARAALQQARALATPSGLLDPIEAQLRSRETADVEIGGLLDAARAALQTGTLDGEDGAIALFRRVLQADAGNALANVGLRDALSAALARANAAIDSGQFDSAAQQIDAVAALDPAHLGLPDALARLAQARERRAAAIDDRLAEAERLLREGQLLSPPQANAVRAFRDVLASDPGNRRAQDGLRDVATALIAQAQRRMADFEFEPATALLDQAGEVSSDAPGLAAARARLRDLERKRDAAALPDPAAPATAAQIATLLGQAEAAAAAGRVLMPPGENAYDSYRAVLTLQPDNAAARAGLAQLPVLVRKRFEEALGANRLDSARNALDTMATIAPADTELPSMRRRLARSFLGQAAERLGAGEIARASTAIDQARELDPTSPELPALQARLEQANGG